MFKMEIIHKSQNPSLSGPTRHKGEGYKMWREGWVSPFQSGDSSRMMLAHH